MLRTSNLLKTIELNLIKRVRSNYNNVDYFLSSDLLLGMQNGFENNRKGYATRREMVASKLPRLPLPELKFVVMTKGKGRGRWERKKR